MRNKHIHVKRRIEAWDIAHMIFDEMNHDQEASDRAGYPIYRSQENYYNYLCDLGNRFECNKADNTTINIWIDQEATTEAPQKAEKTMPILVTIGGHKEVRTNATESQIWEMLRDGATLESIEVK